MGPDHKCEWLCLFAVVTSILLWDGFDINQSFLIVSSPRFFLSAVSHSYYHFLMLWKKFPSHHFLIAGTILSLLYFTLLWNEMKVCSFKPEHVFILKITRFTLFLLYNFNRQVSIILCNLKNKAFLLIFIFCVL